jgi:hypothetical protein
LAVHPSAWGLIIVGLILIVVGYVIWYGIPVPYPLDFLGMILFWIGIALFAIGIILLVVGLVRKATGT